MLMNKGTKQECHWESKTFPRIIRPHSAPSAAPPGSQEKDVGAACALPPLQLHNGGGDSAVPQPLFCFPLACILEAPIKFGGGWVKTE